MIVWSVVNFNILFTILFLSYQGSIWGQIPVLFVFKAQKHITIWILKNKRIDSVLGDLGEGYVEL